ncbi:MAG: hypothetical protein AMXMBFR64_51130 [Myxococcales bacterium]
MKELAALASLLLILAGCATGPEASSGPDAWRNEATEVELDLWITDDFDGPNGDATDWKTFKIDAPTDVTVTVVFEDDGVEANIGLYDRYGMPIAEDKKRKSDNSRMVLKGSLPAGMNFVKVAAASSRDRSNYTIQITADAPAYRPLRPF